MKCPKLVSELANRQKSITRISILIPGLGFAWEHLMGTS